MKQKTPQPEFNETCDDCVHEAEECVACPSCSRCGGEVRNNRQKALANPSEALCTDCEYVVTSLNNAARKQNACIHEAALQMCHELLVLAYKMNAIEPLAREPCRNTFKAAANVLNDAKTSR